MEPSPRDQGNIQPPNSTEPSLTPPQPQLPKEESPPQDSSQHPQPSFGSVVSGSVPSSSPMVSVSSPQPVVSNPYISANTGNTGAVVSSPLLSAVPPAKKKFPKKVMLLVALAVIILGGGGAFAYVGIILPNKPANVLKKAVDNSLQAEQGSYSATINGSPTSGTGLSYKVGLQGSFNDESKAADVQVNATVEGFTIPVELRLVSSNIYIKVGDLSSLISMLGGLDPSIGSEATTLNSQVANKWVVIDSTLLDSAGLGCALDTNWGLSSADITLLNNLYSSSDFADIVSTSNDTVNGKAAEKFTLSLSDNKVAKFVDGLNGLSVVKAADQCLKTPASTSNTLGKSIADNNSSPLTVWVDKASDRVVQLSAQSVASGSSNSDSTEASATININYNPVTIAAPAGAEPALQFLSGIENSLGASGSSSISNLSQLFSGFDSSSSSSSSSITQ